MTITRGLGVGVLLAGLAFGLTSPALAEGPVPAAGGSGQVPPAQIPRDSGWAVIVFADGDKGDIGWAKAATFGEALAQAQTMCTTRTELNCNILLKAPYPECVARAANARPNNKSAGGVGPTADAAYADAVRRLYPAAAVPGEGIAYCTTDPEIPQNFNR